LFDLFVRSFGVLDSGRYATKSILLSSEDSKSDIESPNMIAFVDFSYDNILLTLVVFFVGEPNMSLK